MYEKLWKLIKESKKGNEYLSCKEQYDNLVEILSKLDKNEIKELSNLWHEVHYDPKEFELLHSLVSGDDHFYLDFGNWLVAQGEELYIKFKENGHTAVIDYIKKYNIPESEYGFESMGYVFWEFI